MPRKKGVGTAEVAVPTRSSGRLRSSGRTTESSTHVPSRSRTRTQSSAENVPVPVPVTKTPGGAAKAASSSSVYKKFPDRLHWKMTHFQLPTTSTPKVDFNSRKVTRRDIDTAFGFNDSASGSGGEGNYSTLISPIAHTSPSSNPPVWKIHPLTQRNIELDAPKQKTISPPEDKAASSQKSPVKVIQRTKKTTKKIRSKAKPLKAPELFEDIDDNKADEVGDGISPFSQLMDRYVVKTEKQDVGLHVDPKKVLRTYGSSSRKRVKISEDRETEYDFELPVNMPPTADPTPNQNGRNIKRAPPRTRRKKEDEAKNMLKEIREDEEEYKPDKGDKKTRRAPRKLKKKKEEDELDEETKRWLEEKNKEFEDVLKTPLVIENSFSD